MTSKKEQAYMKKIFTRMLLNPVTINGSVPRPTGLGFMNRLRYINTLHIIFENPRMLKNIFMKNSTHPQDNIHVRDEVSIDTLYNKSSDIEVVAMMMAPKDNFRFFRFLWQRSDCIRYIFVLAKGYVPSRESHTRDYFKHLNTIKITGFERMGSNLSVEFQLTGHPGEKVITENTILKCVGGADG